MAGDSFSSRVLAGTKRGVGRRHEIIQFAVCQEQLLCCLFLTPSALEAACNLPPNAPVW